VSELPENFQTAPLAEVDPAIAAVLEGELRRQQGTLEMIASENFVPQAVLDAVGSVLTNKYAEGYPGRRYYGGCEFVDVVERLAEDPPKGVSKTDVHDFKDLVESRKADSETGAASAATITREALMQFREQHAAWFE